MVRAPAGGVLRHISDLATTQTAQGHLVAVVCDSVANGSLEDERLRELESRIALGVTRLNIRRGVGLGDLMALRDVRRALKRLAPNVVHGHGAKGGTFARLAGTLLPGAKPVRLYAPHGGSLHFDPKSLEGRIYFRVERMLERMTDSIVFVSDYERRTYAEKIGEPRCKTTLIYNGVNEEEFLPVQLESDAADILFVGHLRKLKGVDVLLDALSLLHRQGHRYTARIIGAGEDESFFKNQAQALGLESFIRFHPPMPVREAFRFGRLMVIPSRAESMPYIVLETVAAAVPLVASNVGGIPEILGADTHQLVPPGQPALLAAAMRANLSDWNTAMAQAQAQQARLHERFSLDIMGRNMLSLYTKLLSESGQHRHN